MSKIDILENRIDHIDNLANEIARKSNKELSIAKHKITCLTILIALFALIGSVIALYSIHTLKDLFYDMEIETETIEVDAGDGGNAVGIIGNNNEVNN